MGPIPRRISPCVLSRLTVACWLVTVALMSFYGGARSLDQDEGYSVWLARPGYNHIIQNIRLEPQPPLSFILLSQWIRLGGESDMWVRALSGLIFLAGMAAIWALGRKVLSPRQLRWVLVALVTSKLFLFQAMTARMYTPLEVEACLGTLIYLGLINGRLPARAAGPLLFATSLAGVFTHYFYFYLIGAISLHHLFFSGRFRLPIFFGLAILPTMIFMMLWAPMLQSQLRSGRFKGIATAGASPTPTRPSEQPPLVLHYYGRRGLAVAVPGLIGLALLAWRGGRYRLASPRQLLGPFRRAIRSESFRAVAMIWSACLIAPALVALVRPELSKGLAVATLSLMPFILMVAFVFARYGNAWSRAALALVLLLVTLVSDLQYRHFAIHDPKSDRAWIQRLIERSSPGDSVICVGGNFYPLVDHYLRNDPLGRQLSVSVFPGDLARHPGWYNESMALTDRAGLEREAHDLAVQLTNTTSAPGGKVWVILTNRLHPETSRIFTEALEPTLSIVDQINVSGNIALFDRFLIFEKRQAAATGGAPDAGIASSIANPR